jgi:hypothetical protein
VSFGACTRAAADREVPRAVARLPRQPGVYRFRDAAGGVLRFAVRAGRLCEWSQEPCDAAAAAPAVAATPAGWAGFAQRSAELAAMLSA